MPRGRGTGGGSLADAFAAAYAADLDHPVKLTYKGKDKFGNSIYVFSYRSLRSGTTIRRTAAVARQDGGWAFGPPNSPGLGAPIAGADDVDFGSSSQRNELVDRAIAKLGDLVSRGLLTAEQAKTYDFTTWSDTALRMWISRAGTGNRPGPSVIEEQPEGSAEEALTDIFTGIGGGFGGGGGGGGGGGFAGPVYKKPDERVVEDFVKGMLVSLVGTVPEHLVGPGVERYMRDHRRNFDSPDQEIDPQMSVLELVRGTREYQTIHSLRPDSVDEREWVSQRATEAQRGGLDTGQIEDFAITQATAGADLPDVAEAGAIAQFQRSRQAPALLDQQFRQVAQAMFSRVGR